jgi:hypothetical protein
VALTLCLALLLGAAGGVSLRSEPAQVLLGSHATAQLEIEVGAPGGAPPRLSANVGSVGPVQPAGPGRYRATYSPPPERFPQVAILLAEIDHPTGTRRAWLPVPLHGSLQLKLDTKPNAKVEVLVAGKTFGPTRSDGKGRAELKVQVPPGVTAGTIRSTDRVGNTTRKPLDLAPPPFPLARMAPGPAGGVSWSDSQALGLEIFAIEASGTPSARAPTARAKRGTIGSMQAAGPGVFTASYRAPEKVGEGKDQIEITSGPAPVAVELPVRPGPGVKLEIAFEPPAHTAGSRAPVRARASFVDAKGNAFPAGPATFASDFGSAKPLGPGEVELAIPDAFQGRDKVRVTARAGALSQTAALSLQGGPPATATIWLESDKVRQNSDTPGEVTVRDAHGNPAPDASVASLTATAGKIQDLQAAGPIGLFHFYYGVNPEDATGEARIDARIEPGNIAVSAPVIVLPGQKPWGVAAGLFLAGSTNFDRSAGGGPLLEVAVRPGYLPLEMLLQAGVNFYRPIEAPYPEAGPGVSMEASVLGLAALGGLRFSIPFTSRLAFHASAAGGIQNIRSDIEIRGGAASGVKQSTEPWGPLARGAGGAAFRFGPGRLMGEAQYLWAPAQGDLKGQLGGLSFAAGYLFDIR